MLYERFRSDNPERGCRKHFDSIVTAIRLNPIISDVTSMRSLDNTSQVYRGRTAERAL